MSRWFNSFSSFTARDRATLSGMAIAVAQIAKQQERILSALTDLQSSVANLGTSISNEISAVKASIAASAANNNGSVSAADVEAVVGQLTNLQQTVDAETAALAPQPSPGTAPAA